MLAGIRECQAVTPGEFARPHRQAVIYPKNPGAFNGASVLPTRQDFSVSPTGVGSETQDGVTRNPGSPKDPTDNWQHSNDLRTV